MTEQYSICKKCMCQEWCKAYDKTDLSLNDCTDFIDYERNIDNCMKIDVSVGK